MTAEEVYVDPSALARLFLNQPGAREFSNWRRKLRGSLPVTHAGRVELTNAIALASFRGNLDEAQLSEAMRELRDEFISRRMTPKLGTRAADVLHVACALELNLPRFFSFDVRQQKLAAAVGFKIIQL